MLFTNHINFITVVADFVCKMIAVQFDGKRDGNFMKVGKINCESNLWSTAQR